MIEDSLIIILVLMILGSLYTLHARDLLSAVISYGITGFGLVVCFLLLRAPDLAIVQIVVETITLIIMIAVIHVSTKKDLQEPTSVEIKGEHYFNLRTVAFFSAALIIGGVFLYYFITAINGLNEFGDHMTRMSTAYIDKGVSGTGSVNLVTGILFDFRGYDTLGEATILLTAALGVLTILRLKGRY
jgi:multicomponent Na+:H+ antiporter subunit B